MLIFDGIDQIKESLVDLSCQFNVLINDFSGDSITRFGRQRLDRNSRSTFKNLNTPKVDILTSKIEPPKSR